MIALYVTKTCPRCHQLASWLRQHDIAFEEKDMSQPEVRAELLIDGVFELSAPVLRVDEMWYPSGYLFPDGRMNESELNRIFMQEVNA